MFHNFNHSYPNTEEKSYVFLVELQNLAITNKLLSFTNKLFEKTQNISDDNTLR